MTDDGVEARNTVAARLVPAALPFVISFAMVPAVLAGAFWGGWWLLGPMLYGGATIALIDALIGREVENPDTACAEAALFWHRAVTWAWLPMQATIVGASLWAVGQGWHDPLTGAAILASCGFACGGIGITYAHELVHQKARFERVMAEMLLISVGYGHFRTEHILGHHRTVATPADPVSARKGEGFWSFLPRAVLGSLASAWRIEADRLARRGRPVWDRRNPFWRYGLGFASVLAVAGLIGGWQGALFYPLLCMVAILQLEAINYIEHYGLTRRHLGEGRFERPRPHHSWNAAQRVSNWLLINLQRHSDHHVRPDRRYPLLQHHGHTDAPQLPYGYPVMFFLALVPPLWHRMMDWRVDRWRHRFYPDILDWRAYDDGRIGTAATTA
ncbi:MAG: alkane 1-monooxygenase [Pseudomonadota bacterium]